MDSSNPPEEDRLSGDGSVSSSLEHLISGSQRVVTKRIDLALLEARDLASRAGRAVALIGLGILLVAAAWFALSACVVLWVIPGATMETRLFVFGLLNGGSAIALITLALQNARSAARNRSNGNGAAGSAPGVKS